MNHWVTLIVLVVGVGLTVAGTRSSSGCSPSAAADIMNRRALFVTEGVKLSFGGNERWTWQHWRFCLWTSEEVTEAQFGRLVKARVSIEAVWVWLTYQWFPRVRLSAFLEGVQWSDPGFGILPSMGPVGGFHPHPTASVYPVPPSSTSTGSKSRRASSTVESQASVPSACERTTHSSETRSTGFSPNENEGEVAPFVEPSASPKRSRQRVDRRRALRRLTTHR